MVNARGSELRQLNYSALQERAKAPLEHGTVQGRRAKIGIIELPAPDGSIRVVVQGFMKVLLGMQRGSGWLLHISRWASGGHAGQRIQ
jgi:hypothetical protein